MGYEYGKYDAMNAANEMRRQGGRSYTYGVPDEDGGTLDYSAIFGGGKGDPFKDMFGGSQQQQPMTNPRLGGITPYGAGGNMSPIQGSPSGTMGSFRPISVHQNQQFANDELIRMQQAQAQPQLQVAEMQARTQMAQLMMQQREAEMARKQALELQRRTQLGNKYNMAQQMRYQYGLGVED